MLPDLTVPTPTPTPTPTVPAQRSGSVLPDITVPTATVPAQRGGTRAGPTVARALDAVRPDRLIALLQEMLSVPSVTGSAAESDA
ncbi:MAG: hypothetical protein LC789_09920, partial [Actinobacteria bacterium]|nr:hypothetical protein [Actinomycetota bacterium]MCA1722573.1 hypothetical protein [Actinomycetota bacterium]